MIMSALPVALIKSRQPGSRPCATFLGNLGNVRSAFCSQGSRVVERVATRD